MFDHFGLVAPLYDRTIPFSRTEQLVKIASLAKEGILLDAAGGTGRVAEALRTYVKEVYIADVSRGMLNQASGKGLISVQTPLESLPFAEGTFDRIILVDALHHVNDQRSTIADLWRVLKIGGCIVIEEPDIRTWQVKILAVLEKLALMRSHFLNPLQISMLLPEEASVDIEIDGFNAWLIISKK